MELRNALLKTVICLGALALTAGLPLYPAFFGEIPGASEGLLTLAPWSEARPEGIALPPQPDAGTLQRLAWHILTPRLWSNEGTVLWNRYSDCGMPHFALWHTRTASPFSLPLYLLSPARALVVSAWLKLFIAGLGAFLLARNCGVPRLLALAAALGFQWSGLLLTQLPLPFSDALPWVPYLLLCFERLSRGLSWWWLPVPILTACMLLGGAPVLTAAALLGGVLFFLLRVGQHRMGAFEGAPLLLWLAVAIALGVGLAAFQVLPFLEFAGVAERTGMPTAPSALGWRSLGGAIAPVLAPHVPGASAPPAAYSYFGIAPLCLLPLWLALRPFAGPLRRSRVDAWYGLALASLLAARLAAFQAWHGFLGGVGPGHWLAWEGLVLTLAAAEIADEWVALNAEACRASLRRLLYFGPLPLVVGLLLLLFRDPAAPAHAGGLWAGAVYALLIGLAMFVLVAFTLLRPKVPVMGLGMALLMGGELFFVFQPAMAFSKAAWLFPETRFIDGLRAGEGRVAGLRGMQEWPLLGNLVPHVYGPGVARLHRHAALAQASEEDPLLLRRLGAQAMLLSREDITGPFAPVRPQLKLKHVFQSGAGLFGDLQSKSRLRVAYEVEEVASEGFLALPGPPDPNRPPLVEGRLPTTLQPPSAPPVITVLADEAVRLHCRVDSATPGLLILADTWYPGWTARVNGAAVPVYPVDRFARGVLIGAGQSEIEMTYACKPLRRGALVSAASAALLVLAALLGYVRWRRQTSPWWAKGS